MELVKNRQRLKAIEEYCFNKMVEIFTPLFKNAQFKKMPRLWHFDGEIDIDTKKYAVEIKQRNKPNSNDYYWLTKDKLKHILEDSKDYDKSLYLILHMGKWLLFDLSSMDWEKIPTKKVILKEREIDGDSPYIEQETYLIPEKLAIKSGVYDVGEQP